MASGRALRLHTSSLWPMKVTGFSRILGAGSQSHRSMEDPSTLYRMGCYFDVIFMDYLTVTKSQLTLMYVFYFLKKL